MSSPGWERFASPDAGTGRGRALATCCIVLGAALTAAVLTHRWPAAWLPPGHDDPSRGYDLRLFELMLAIEGIGLVGLGIVARVRAAWMQSWGGIDALESRHASASIIVLAVHAAACAFYLPPQQILSPEPVHTGAHLAHYYRIFAGERLLSLGRTWGYDPFFLCGMPTGVALDLDSRGDTFFASVLSFLSLATATKAYILFVEGFLPIALYAAARIFGARRGVALAGAFLAILHWHWGRPVLGTMRWLGTHSFLLAVELVVLAIACAVRTADPHHRVRAAAFGGLVVLGGAMTAVHPAGLLLWAPAAAIAFAGGAARFRGRDWAALVLLLVFLAALQTSWFPAYRRLHPLFTSGEPPAQLRGPTDLAAAFLRPTSWPALAILGLAYLGLMGLRATHPLRAWTLGGTLAVWLAAAVGAASFGPLSRLEWARVLVPVVLLACVAAGPVALQVLAGLQRWLGPLGVAIVLLVSCTLPPFLAVLDSRFFYVHRLHASYPPGVANLAAALDTAAPAAARVLFESTANERTRLTDGEPLEALMPLYTRRELVGPPLPTRATAAIALSFGAGELGGRPLAAWTRSEFADFLERYDVGAVVAWSAPARAFLSAQLSTVAPASMVDGFEIYRTLRAPARVRGGTATAHLDYDRLLLTEISADTLVLRAHWIPGLHATPPLRIAREAVPGDPLGFIRLEPRGVPSLLLQTAR